ncbi:MAG: PBP1A family penicillin-binding protein [Acidobacteria bacterium]|nr:PBP1A family penicillin-binding protein [Acidobacteriota bacterium]
MIDRVTALARASFGELLKRPILLALPGIALALGAVTGGAIAYAPDDAIVDALRQYEPSLVTRIHGRDGEQYAEWLTQRREVVAYEDIAPVMVNAVVATEDAKFFSHVGIDPLAVVRSLIADIRCGYFCEGFSTITMQIPRNLDRYLGGETWLPKSKTLTRKIREGIYAIQIERHYTKEQIFAIYANQIFMGSKVYGFQSAAKFYFGKSISDVNLPEAALLAGIIQTPNSFRPDLNPERAVRKRNVVLGRMLAEGFISDEEHAVASIAPLVLADEDNADGIGDYFTEEIRKRLITEYGMDGIYRGGLRVNTTLDNRVQTAAEVALDKGIRAVDKAAGWRGATTNLLQEGADLETWVHPAWFDRIEPGNIVKAVVLEVEPERARVRFMDQVAELTPEDIEWTNRTRLHRLVEPGDLIEVKLKELREDGTWRLLLDQEPTLQGSVLVVENHTGEVTAMVGGRTFDQSEFNRATQAVRPTGSIFKPFVYSAAVQRGITPSELFVDQPETFYDASRQPYSPENFNNEYIGITSMAEALTKSRNVPTVMLQQKVGLTNVIDTARSFGLTADFQPYLSLGLGVMDISVWEIVRAYTVFPNQGVLVEPHLVKEVFDRNGRLLEEAERQARKVLSSDEAYVMARILVAGIQRGTGVRAKPLANELGLMLGGKSGTTDDRTNTWYVGFSPNHTVGVWLGHDDNQRIHRYATGASSALPIWIDVMRAAEDGASPAVLPMPNNIELRSVDVFTGLLYSEYCKESVELAYIAGTAPTRTCGPTERSILDLPPYQQTYFVSNGKLDTDGG